MYLLVERYNCYECNGETEPLYANEDKNILEKYNKIYDNRYEIIEVPTLKNEIEKYNYIRISVRIFNDYMDQEGIKIQYDISTSDTINIANVELNRYEYTEWDKDSKLDLIIDKKDIDSEILEMVKYLGNGIYKIRKEADKLNNVTEIQNWLKNEFKTQLNRIL
jgi:hypothetical protein